MRPSIALNLHRAKIIDLISQYPTTNPRIFGSVLHGTDKEGSDLDILVDALPGATLFDLCRLQDDLEKVVGMPVDLKTPSDLSKRFREEVLNEACPI